MIIGDQRSIGRNKESSSKALQFPLEIINIDNYNGREDFLTKADKSFCAKVRCGREINKKVKAYIKIVFKGITRLAVTFFI